MCLVDRLRFRLSKWYSTFRMSQSIRKGTQQQSVGVFFCRCVEVFRFVSFYFIRFYSLSCRNLLFHAYLCICLCVYICVQVRLTTKLDHPIGEMSHTQFYVLLKCSKHIVIHKIHKILKNSFSCFFFIWKNTIGNSSTLEPISFWSLILLK